MFVCISSCHENFESMKALGITSLYSQDVDSLYALASHLIIACECARRARTRGVSACRSAREGNHLMMQEPSRTD